MIDLHCLYSSNGRKVSMLLEELGLPYRVILYDIAKGEHLNAAYRKINPNGRLPAIVDHEPIGGGEPFAVFESGAILLYLSEKSGGKFMPTDPRRRSAAQQWLMWQMAGLGPMLGQANHFLRYAPEGQTYAINRYLHETKRLFAVMQRHLATTEYFADEYSVADIAAWPWVLNAQTMLGVKLTDYPSVGRWFDEIGKRPAVVRGIEFKSPDNLAGSRPVLAAEEWSNLFGENMLKSAEA